MHRYVDHVDPALRLTEDGATDRTESSADGERAAARAQRWLERLEPSALAALGAGLAGELAQRGLTVHDADTGGFRPIAASLTPEPLERDRVLRLADDSRSLLSAAVKAAHHALSQGALSPAARPSGIAAHRLFARFTPLEMAFLRRHPDALGRVASARIDFFQAPGGFEAPGGGPVALEINATIPAMQGYSDILSQGWLARVAACRGGSRAEVDALVARETSNTSQLLDSLLAHYRLAGGRAVHPALAIVSRRGDAQLAELRHYESVFAQRGHRALQVYDDELEIDPAGRVRARGQRFDLIYRHIFARRIDPDSVLARLLLEPGPTPVLNPIVSPLEAKGLLALLHTAVFDPDAAAVPLLDEAERDAVSRLLPWTRLLDDASARLADGSLVPDLAAWVAENPQRVVLKRNWDYGGRSVILGPSCAEPEMRRRAELALGVASWPEIVARASRDADAWVVQAYVEPPRRRRLLLETSAAGEVAVRWRDVFTDLGIFTNLGVETCPHGAAARCSATPIVNILGGGGMVPLVSAAGLEALFPPPPRPQSG